jgi:hypothetical protein
VTIAGIQSRYQFTLKLVRRPSSVPLQLTPMVSSGCGASAAGPERSHHDVGAVRTGYADMIGQSAHKTANQRKPKARKFYIIGCSPTEKRANFEVENLDVLRAGALALYPPEGQRGFPAYREKPRVVIGGRRNAHPPRDIETFHSYWLISDRLKVLFESEDPQAFAFLPCDVKLRDGSTGPVYWLCDVVRVLDAFGERTLQDIRRYREKTGLTYRSFIRDKTIVFNEDIIGDFHIFRTPYSFMDVFCDQRLKDACKQAGIKGVRFS